MLKNNSSLKPFLKWAGGKRQLLPEIKKQFPVHVEEYNYYEPFLGGGAVFFDLQPRKAVISDTNSQLIMTYMAIKMDLENLMTLLADYKQKNDKEYYYSIRNLDRDSKHFNTLSDTEKAARFIYLNKTCFNGLYRVNAAGLFNVPFGKYKNPSLYEEPVLQNIHEYFNSSAVTILNEDFESAVSNADTKSFIYFDPPYHSPDKTNFTGYQSKGFDENEQERLQRVMVRLTERGLRCLLSNADTEFIRDIYNHHYFHLIPVKAKRLINSDSAGRGSVSEVLVKNWSD
ncbi:modification methylase [Spirochaetia bacterium]|nr:modification methylase [Spirochaetia bacterium]